MANDANKNINKQTNLRLFYEQVYHDALDLASTKSGKIIYTSKGRFMRKELSKRLDLENGDLSRVGQSKILTEINNILDENGFGTVFEGDMDTIKNDKIYGAMLSKFKKLRSNLYESDNLPTIPLSPYDPVFENRSIFRENGSKLLYIDNNTARGIEDLSKIYNKQYGENIDIKILNEDSGILRKAGSLTIDDDYSGLSVLSNYMSKNEYNSVRSWLNSLDKDQYMSDQAIERSVGILKYLQDSGQEYTVVCDRYPGQIKANLTGTGISVRITDTKENEGYVGRIIDRNRTYHYSLEPASGKKPSGNKADIYKEQTIEDAINLIKHAKGDYVWGDAVDVNGNARPSGMVGVYKSGNNFKHNAYYVSGDKYSMKVKTIVDSNGVEQNVILRSLPAKGVTNPMAFKTPELAEEYLRNSVESARLMFASSIGVEDLIEEFNNSKDIKGYEPHFEGHDEIVDFKTQYWRALKNNQNIIDDEGNEYSGEIEDQIREHANNMVDKYIGQYDVGSDGKRFSPTNVARYMLESRGETENLRDFESAFSKLDIDFDELKGDDFYSKYFKDKLIKFDKDTAKPLKDLARENPFAMTIFRSVYNTIRTSGCQINQNDIFIDDNGIIEYTALKASAANDANGPRALNGDYGSMNKITGYIGQVFIPEKEGYVVTKYGSRDNYIFVPGYEATIVANKEGEELGFEERTRLTGYPQKMASEIRHRLRLDLSDKSPVVGTNTSLNNVYSGLYDSRHDLDFFDKSAEEGLPREVLDCVLKAEASKVKYSEFIKNGSTINADYQAKNNLTWYDLDNDNFYDAYRLTNGTNMSIMHASSDGYFDPVASANSTNQGVTKYLVPSAVVNEDGSIARGDIDDKLDLYKLDLLRYYQNVPWDRNQMTFTNLMSAVAITDSVNVASMTLDGWNFEDGVIISKKFAQNYQVRGIDGQMRDLIERDKIADMYGNKGVVGLIVDPDMDIEEAKKLGIEKEVLFFKNNPTLDIVQAPFSGVSRFNAGTTLELMENPQDLIDLDGNVVNGGMGQQKFIITPMTADYKSKIYDDEAYRQGKGRKASAQLAWALSAKGLENSAIFREFYGNNSTALSNLREIAISLGCDINELGEIENHYKPHSGEDRTIFTLPEPVYNEDDTYEYPDFIRKDSDTNPDILDAKKMVNNFSENIAQNGGFLEIPFQLTYPNGHKLEETENGTYLLPIMSSYLRSGVDLENGTTAIHNYTRLYLDIYETSIKYLDSKQKLDSGKYSGTNKENKLQKDVDESESRCQSIYNRLSNDLIKRNFDTKHNIFRDGIMTNRLPNSGSLVISANPNLNLDEVAISPEYAKKLRIKEGDTAAIWRDPILKDGGIRAVDIKIAEGVNGMQMHPSMTKCFDADFDGDQMAIYKLQSPEAIKEAKENFSMASNLLDFGSKDESGKFSLYFNTGLDIKVAMHYKPEFKDRYNELTDKANQIYEAFGENKNGLLPSNANYKKVLLRENKKILNDLNDLLHECNDYASGKAINRYDTLENHMKSFIQNTVETGAKGSMSKVHDYSKYMGLEYEKNEDNTIDYNTLNLKNHTLATREDMNGVQYATAIKAFGTGVAGMFSQKAMSVLRNYCPKAALELTYPNTQAALQAKHDPVAAAHIYKMLMGPTRDIWRGRELEEVTYSDGSRGWKAKRDEYGRCIQASPKVWLEQFKELYTSKDGLGLSVNEDFIKDVGRVLYDKDSKTMMDIETDGKLYRSSPLDRLAYGGSFKLFVEMSESKEKVNLFDGKISSQFAPNIIRNNKYAVENNYEVKAFGKSDVKIKENKIVQPIIEKNVVKEDGKQDLDIDLDKYKTYTYEDNTVKEIVSSKENIDELDRIIDSENKKFESESKYSVARRKSVAEKFANIDSNIKKDKNKDEMRKESKTKLKGLSSLASLNISFGEYDDKENDDCLSF